MGLVRSWLARHPERNAISWRGGTVTYRQLQELVDAYVDELDRLGASAGTVLAARVDCTPDSVAFLLAAIEARTILVPLDRRSGASSLTAGLELAQAEMLYEVGRLGGTRAADVIVQLTSTGHRAAHPLYDELRQREAPGLVLFTSGSSGEPKGAVHDVDHLLRRFRSPGKDLRTLLFFFLDHISGLDTLFYALSNGSEIVAPDNRSVDNVCRNIERYAVEVLPTSPSFLNLLVLGRGAERFDLSSLVYITYGGEVMPERTLERLTADFPDVRLSQKYGSTEVGALRISPESSSSVWFRFGDAGTKTRIVDGVLQIRSSSAMLGYLNAESPFTEDGWYDTRDAVEQRGDLVRILGRVNDAISVGGERVHPAKIENVILQLDEVADVSVFGEPNIVLGNVVCARVVPSREMDRFELRRKVQRHCRARLAPRAVPVRVIPERELPLAPNFK